MRVEEGGRSFFASNFSLVGALSSFSAAGGGFQILYWVSTSSFKDSLNGAFPFNALRHPVVCLFSRSESYLSLFFSSSVVVVVVQRGGETDVNNLTRSSRVMEKYCRWWYCHLRWKNLSPLRWCEWDLWQLSRVDGGGCALAIFLTGLWSSLVRVEANLSEFDKKSSQNEQPEYDDRRANKRRWDVPVWWEYLIKRPIPLVKHFTVDCLNNYERGESARIRSIRVVFAFPISFHERTSRSFLHIASYT